MADFLAGARNLLGQSIFIPEPQLNEKNLPDQSGKVFIITGANSGVGYHLSSLLYGCHATVYLGCRSAEKANEAISSITKAHPNSRGKAIYLHLDLSDLSSIKASVTEFLSKESKLHWLNNNAGVMFPPLGSRTAQNFELQLGTNVLGPFLLTQLLLPLLKETAKSEPAGSVRVSWAGSLAVDLISPRAGVEFTRNQNNELTIVDYGGKDIAYGASKAANYLLAREFGRRGTDGHGDGVLHTAYNPGNLDTGLQRDVNNRPYVGPIIKFIFKCILYPGRMGAYTELYAGLSPDITLKDDQGAYVVPWGRKATWNRADVKNAVGEGKTSDTLYEWCEQSTKAYL